MTIQRTLKRGEVGLAVALWNTSLINRGLMFPHGVDYRDFDMFGSETEEATKRYQRSKSLIDSAILDSDAYSKASEEGLIDGFVVEKAIAAGLNRISNRPNKNFEVVFSTDGNVVFSIPLGAADVGTGIGRTAEDALDSFGSTFIG